MTTTQPKHDSAADVAKRIKEWLGKYGRENTASLLLYEAMQALEATTPPASKPSASWRANGMEDPHGNQYDCERAALVMGDLSDDALANGAFMNYDRQPSVTDILDRTAFSPIVWMTAVKDRIRWLSRSLEKALAAQANAPAVAWVRYRSDGGTPELLLDTSKEMDDVRRKSGAWKPLVHAPAMVDMVPPATARDRWMYEQGRLAERDPRTHATNTTETQ